MTGDGDLRGGYLRQDRLSLAAAAVIVVDMTNDFCHADGVYARHGADCAPLRALLPNIAAVMAAARSAGRPVVLCSQFIFRDAAGNAVASPGMVAARPWLAAEGLAPGSWGTRIVDGLPTPDFTIDKPRASGFFATSLDLLLRGLGVDTVILLGGYTNHCIEATARDAWALDYRVVLPPDGTACFDPALHEATLTTLAPLTTQRGAAAIVAGFAAMPSFRNSPDQGARHA